MKLTRSLLALSLCFSLSLLSFLALPLTTAIAQETNAALQRGYRTGYSDGYMAGYRDVIDNSSKDYSHHQEYSDASRAYNKDYGSLEDYRDGYRQGFEKGYDTGFEKRSFDSSAPSGITRRGDVMAAVTHAAEETTTEPVEQTDLTGVPPVEAFIAEETAVEASPQTQDARADAKVPIGVIQKVAYQPSDDPMIIIPRDTELILELQEPLDTERNREGDKFTAKVVAPHEIVGAIVEGRIDKVERPGRIKKRSAMLLSFDRIIISERRWSNFDAIMTEVLPAKGDNIKRVDNEGAAIGKSTLKPDAAKVGAATGAGVGIGAITGGPVGAAVGAGVGAAFGVGAVIIERGKHINLRTSQQLRVKTSYETHIR
jgi:hypothetical protein